MAGVMAKPRLSGARNSAQRWETNGSWERGTGWFERRADGFLPRKSLELSRWTSVARWLSVSRGHEFLLVLTAEIIPLIPYVMVAHQRRGGLDCTGLDWNEWEHTVIC